MLEQRTGNLLRGEGLRGAEGFRFPRSTAPAKTAADDAAQAAKVGKTTSEVAKAKGPSGIIRSIYQNRVFYPSGGSDDIGRDRRDAIAAANEADAELAGVDEKSAKGLRDLGALAAGKEGEQEASKARGLLSSLATTGPTEKRLAAIQVMRDSGLVTEADAAAEKLPGGVREVVQARQSAPGTDIAGLEAAALSGDGQARYELVRLSGLPGPDQKAAGAALIRMTRRR
jgi:hypothetical protein